MDLSTNYLGLQLSSPLLPGASPLVDHLDMVKRLEDAGAAAITMHSLFEEQIEREQLGTLHAFGLHSDQHAEALSYFPDPSEFALGPHQYLDQLLRLRRTVKIPVIASLNGVRNAKWLEYA